MSISLKVVNMAVSFFTATRRSAIFRRSIDIFSRRVSLVPPQPAEAFPSNPADKAFITSFFVMRPSFPVALIWADLTLFSSINLAAAGDGVPAAYEATGFGFGTTASSFFGTGAAAGGVATSFAGALPAGLAALVSIKHTT